MAASMLLSLVNTSVVSATNKTILRWSILEVPEEVQTIEQFFRRGVLARIAEEDSRRCDLLSAYIGKDREMLDHVDLSLPIVPVVVSFGPFLKFVVRIDNKGSYNKEAMKDHPKVLQFITHCCQESHYSFDILKCGKPDCEFCKPIRLPIEVFNKLNHIPHPVLGDDGHYLPFNEVFGLATTDEQRPSFKKVKDPKRKRAKVKLHFSASVQHVKNSEIMVQCCECGLWRLVFSKYRLKKNDRDSLRGFLEDMTYSCGSFLKDLNLPDTYKDVEIRDHDCYDPIEKLYYSANYEPICYYCGIDQPYTSSGHYPQCNNCIDKPVVAKK